MGQGVTAVKDEFGREWKKILHQRAALIRARVPEYQSRFKDDHIDTKGSSSLSKAYSEAPAFYKKYIVSNMPSENQLIADLSFILELYSKLTFLGGTDLVENNDTDKEIGEDLTLIEKKRFRLHQKVEGRVNTDRVKKHHGYTCTACEFNFKNTYGELGNKFIEAHHLIPYSELGEGNLRKLDIEKDFAVLCANCHRMIHRMADPSDINGLRSLVKRNLKK
ncbi:MAG: DUF3578 domain-containing protein [Alphaproteobacteria bacterium]|nr:DUF3578 domain-containing protein [Alphaproteobacteria bacterium]